MNDTEENRRILRAFLDGYDRGEEHGRTAGIQESIVVGAIAGGVFVFLACVALLSLYTAFGGQI